MKSNFLKVSILALVTIFTISCSKDESSNTTQSSTTTTSTVTTFAKFTVATPAGVVKPNYIVMMFETPFTPNTPLPTIIKQATSDANGIAYLDLNTTITSTTLKKYYFEAFTLSGTTYTLKTNFSRFNSDLKNGSNLTTTLLVN
ncbi:MAG: hypothetical protein H7239_03460 [Flavobacterium sp.]|nr:hypothetical protein [Flavobacterium sp.]